MSVLEQIVQILTRLVPRPELHPVVLLEPKQVELPTSKEVLETRVEVQENLGEAQEAQEINASINASTSRFLTESTFLMYKFIN